jgi:hypothetical protein
MLRLYRLTSDWLRSIGVIGDLRPEEPLTSQDGLIVGKLDLLARGGTQAILDYKTGQTIERSRLKRDIREQLELYAWLLSEQTGSWPEYLAAISPHDSTSSWRVSDDTKEAGQAIARAMKEALAAWNSRLESVAVATPTAAGCRFCAFKGHCESFWAAAITWPDSPMVAELEVTESRDLAHGGLMYLCRLIRASHELREPAPRFLRIRDWREAPADLLEAHRSQSYPMAVVLDGFAQRGAALDLVAWSRVAVLRP